MIKNIELIKQIENKKIHAMTVAFETTRRCNTPCGFCYKGKPQEVDISPKVPYAVLDYFNDIDRIHLFGAESTLSIDGLANVAKAIGDIKPKFNGFSMITNGTVFEKEFFEILKSIESHAEGKGRERIRIEISNDFAHDGGMKKAGIPKSIVYENYEEMKNLYPMFDIVLREYTTKEQFQEKFGEIPSGLERDMEGKYDDIPDVIYPDMFFQPDKTKDGKYKLLMFQTDANGNTIKMHQSYRNGDTKNMGNVLAKPISEILIENGWGDATDCLKLQRQRKIEGKKQLKIFKRFLDKQEDETIDGLRNSFVS